METIKSIFAKKLLEVKAVKLQPDEPFTWASGWRSPIYTDNRKTLSYPALRSFVKIELCHLIQEHFPEADAVAGVATGAIAQGALVADEMGLTFCYGAPSQKTTAWATRLRASCPQGRRWWWSKTSSAPEAAA